MISVEASLFAGIDWATQHHDVCVVDSAGVVVGEQRFPHSGDGLEHMVAWLRELAGGESVQPNVAIEVPHGPVVETLLEQGFTVYSVNPKQLDRFRDRFSLPAAKDDRLDARVLADSLRTDRSAFRQLDVRSPVVIELREWSRILDDLKDQRVVLANRFEDQLRRYYPQFLQISNNVAARWSLALWERVPTPERAQSARTRSIQKLLREHRVKRLDAEAVVATLTQKPVTTASGTTEAATAHIRVLIRGIRLANEQILEATRHLDRCLAQLEEDDAGQEREQRDTKILRSLPGVGRIVVATLLAEATEPLRQRDYHALRALAGVAPVTRRSGKRRMVLMRRACHPRVREAVYHWSRVAVIRDPLSRSRYAALRARGHSHGRALRTIGDRLLTVACAMLSNNTEFDSNHQSNSKST